MVSFSFIHSAKGKQPFLSKKKCNRFAFIKKETDLHGSHAEYRSLTCSYLCLLLMLTFKALQKFQKYSPARFTV